MNVLIAGGFWSIAKFMVLLCCTIVSMIKAIYFYINTVKKWKKITQIFYIMMIGSFLLSLIIGLCGVVGLIRNYWDAGSLSMLIFSQVSGGIFVKELLKNDYIYLSKWFLKLPSLNEAAKLSFVTAALVASRRVVKKT